MSPLDPLEILQVIGYSIGALLPLWILFQLVRHRSKLTNIERLLALLALTMGGWHTSNLVITLHGLFDLGQRTRALAKPQRRSARLPLLPSDNLSCRCRSHSLERRLRTDVHEAVVLRDPLRVLDSVRPRLDRAN